MDLQCVKYEKSLLESGTMGTGGNVDTIFPHKTRTYRDGGNAVEGGDVPMCTLRNFPQVCASASLVRPVGCDRLVVAGWVWPVGCGQFDVQIRGCRLIAK